MDSLVSTAWLAAELGAPDLAAPNLAIVDCTAFMPGSERVAATEFAAAHIPGARFLDIGQVADRSNPAPHMLPSADDFASAMEQLGIARDHRILVYDNSPLRTAARGWFMFRHFGATQIAILDGGLQKWLAEARPTESGSAQLRHARFVPAPADNGVVAKADVLATGLPLIDARGSARFEGSEPDPRPGVAAGHIPGSRNLPFGQLYEDDGTFRSPDEIRALFEATGIDPAQPFVASCGSGVTANSLIFAAHLLGNEAARLYDGSWSEWGADPATPKAIGPA